MAFDPYHKWLMIPPGARPPSHYQLLGVDPAERDPAVLRAALLQRAAFVRNFQAGEHGECAARLLEELEEAGAVLSAPERRIRYNAEHGIPNRATPESAASQTQAPLAAVPATVTRSDGYLLELQTRSERKRRAGGRTRSRSTATAHTRSVVVALFASLLAVASVAVLVATLRGRTARDEPAPASIALRKPEPRAEVNAALRAAPIAPAPVAPVEAPAVAAKRIDEKPAPMEPPRENPPPVQMAAPPKRENPPLVFDGKGGKKRYSVPSDAIEVKDVVDGGGIGGRTYWVRRDAKLFDVGGSCVFLVEPGGSVSRTGGSCTVVLMKGASFDSGGSGSHTFYVEGGAKVIDPGGGFVRHLCTSIKIEP